MINKKAFTLTELLIALAIIGAIGGLTLPSLLTKVNERMLNTKYENTKQQVQQLIFEQMLEHHTKVLQDTDFADPENILGKNNQNIEIIEQEGCDANTNCSSLWDLDNREYFGVTPKTKTKTKKNIVIYSVTTKDDEGNDVITDVNIADDNVRTASLKNGVLASYYYNNNDKDENKGCGTFLLDLNGADGPNIIDRDVRSFRIDPNGKIGDINITSREVAPVIPRPGMHCMLFCPKGTALNPTACRCEKLEFKP